MVLIDFFKSFAWEGNFMSKFAFSFSTCFACSVAIMSSRTSIAIMNFKDFHRASTFWYSTSNFICCTCRRSKLTLMTVNRSWRVGSWTQYSSFSAKDFSNQVYIPTKSDLANFSAWIVKASCQAFIWPWRNSFLKHRTSTFAFKASSSATSFLIVVASKVWCKAPIGCTC